MPKQLASYAVGRRAALSMSRFKFHDICDHCGAPSPEYTPWYVCRKCDDIEGVRERLKTVAEDFES